jgi:citrate lyase subunit beta/citryl-CoA lyase
MRFRSLLFVPGDRPDRMRKAFAAGADALILDLEDAVAPAAKPEARRHVAEFVGGVGGSQIWVRVNPLDSPENERDLDAILAERPHGIVLPKAEGGHHVDELARRLTERGNVSAQIMAIATETPAAIFGLGSYGGAKRLAGLTWGAEDLPAAIGAVTSREEDGSFTAPVRDRPLALPVRRGGGRGHADRDGLPCLQGSGRAGGLCGAGAAGRLYGHDGDPPGAGAGDQRRFTPSVSEVEHARAVAAAFDAQPGAGALSLDGRMIDRPHLVQARRILQAAGES